MENQPDLEAFLKVINQPLWEWTIAIDREIIVTCPNRRTARVFIRRWLTCIKAFTINFNCDRTVVRYPNCQKPFVLPITFEDRLREDKFQEILFNIQAMSKQQSNLQLTPFQTNIPGVGEVTFPEFFQFLAEETRKGRFWVIAELGTERILFLTDNAEPGRLTVPVHQHIGLNRYDAWRDSFDDYERLQHLLTIDKIAPSFEYNRYRLDNSFVHFQKTHYLIEGLWGTQCRASVAEGWELIRPTND
ncbi:MAG: hypothetical protein J7647_07280 [Cyanobacteria bacterium SBLK]|nr:hypothetical protein [Cyanobacteria bacterium SBLK]